MHSEMWQQAWEGAGAARWAAARNAGSIISLSCCNREQMDSGNANASSYTVAQMLMEPMCFPACKPV